MPIEDLDTIAIGDRYHCSGSSEPFTLLIRRSIYGTIEMVEASQVLIRYVFNSIRGSTVEAISGV